MRGRSATRAAAANTRAGFGSAYPTPSPVQHTYERKGTYTIAADLVLTGRYWYEELRSPVRNVTRTVTLRHDVVEIRCLLHAR